MPTSDVHEGTAPQTRRWGRTLLFVAAFVVLIALMNALLTLLMEQSWCPEENQESPRKKNVIFSVKEYLDQHLAEKITLDSLASGFYINKFYLAKAFKQYYGMTISAYLLQIRITRAKQMLRFSEKSMKEIGLECGLGEPHYFSARFREVEGVPPSQYRAQW